MSPTFSDRIRREQRERIGLYGAGAVGSRVGLDRPDSRPVEPSYRSWPAQDQWGPIEDRGYVLEERKPISSVCILAYLFFWKCHFFLLW
jgi:hypothetical protein